MKKLKLSVFFQFQKNHKPQNIEDISNNASQTFESLCYHMVVRPLKNQSLKPQVRTGFSKCSKDREFLKNWARESHITLSHKVLWIPNNTIAVEVPRLKKKKNSFACIHVIPWTHYRVQTSTSEVLGLNSLQSQCGKDGSPLKWPS